MTASQTRTETHPAKTPPPAPGALLIALELRAIVEFWSIVPTWPALMRAPTGDGHPVIVFPGLTASDNSTLPLRGFLSTLGYNVSGWNQGYNFGPRAGVLNEAKRQIQETFKATGEKISLIGWSLGGIYARELAKLMPKQVRSVITLGTPFAQPPQSTNASRVYEMTSERLVSQITDHFDLPAAPPVPTTSVYSRTDGVVAWPASLQAPCPRNRKTENVEVFASHAGIGVNPSAWWVVADRLAQPQGQWKAFERPSGLTRCAFPRPQ